MPAPLVDCFADLPISRQRKYQLRKRLEGKCRQCGAPSKGFTLCNICAIVVHYRQGAKCFYSVTPRTKAKQAKAAKIKANPWISVVSTER